MLTHSTLNPYELRCWHSAGKLVSEYFGAMGRFFRVFEQRYLGFIPVRHVGTNVRRVDIAHSWFLLSFLSFENSLSASKIKRRSILAMLRSSCRLDASPWRSNSAMRPVSFWWALFQEVGVRRTAQPGRTGSLTNSHPVEGPRLRAEMTRSPASPRTVPSALSSPWDSTGSRTKTIAVSSASTAAAITLFIPNTQARSVGVVKRWVC
jgi:hypothetical protein